MKKRSPSDSWGRGVFGALRILVHLIAATHFSYACYYDWNYVKVPENLHRMGNSFGGKLKYLTFLDAIIQSVYFTICLINDFVGTNEVAPKKLPLIRKIKDYMLAALAFPVAMNVGITFWGLMAVDRELVFPAAFDAFFPSWLNHVMHTNIMLFIIIELFITFRQYPSRTKGLGGHIFFMLSYLIWMHVVKYYSGIWVYPIFDVLDVTGRIIFFVAMFIFATGIYFLGELINNKVWAKELRSINKKSHNKVK